MKKEEFEKWAKGNNWLFMEPKEAKTMRGSSSVKMKFEVWLTPSGQILYVKILDDGTIDNVSKELEY